MFNPNSPEYAQVSPAYAMDSPSYGPGSQQQLSGGTINKYSIGQTVSLRGLVGGGKNNVWKIQDITPEFTTVINDEEMRVVDNNEVCPFIQSQHGQPIQNDNQNPYFQHPYLQGQQSYDQMFQMPMIKPEEKPAPVNVVVVTGDKNELSGLSNTSTVETKPITSSESITDKKYEKQSEKQTEKKGGSNESSSTGGSSILDFTKSFFIKKMDT